MSDRRDFFRGLARGAAGLLLLGGTGLLMTKSGSPCWADGGCRGCPSLSSCDLPEAEIARVQRRPDKTADGETTPKDKSD